MATMKEIAALAGVSIATVSYVLNGTKKLSPEVEARVLKAVEQTHYQPNIIAKSLRLKKTNIIGILVEDICGMPVAEIVDGISDYLENRGYKGYQVLLSNLRLLQKLHNQYEQMGKYTDVINRGMQLMENARVEGIVYVAMHDRLITGIRHPVHIPMVYAYATTDSQDIPSITYDNEHSAYEITKRLIAANHKRIALIAGHSASVDAQLRLSGFKTAMDEAGLYVPAEYIRWGDWEFQSGLEQGSVLMSMVTRPTAVFVMNDLMAAGCYRAVKNHGLQIPDDISVAGFDNREIARLINPPLTTVALPNQEIGYRAAEMLMAKIERTEGLPMETILSCTIIDRESVASI